MRLQRTASSLLLLGLVMVSTSVAAPPDAGTLLNEQRQQGSTLPGRLPKPDKDAPEKAPQPDRGTKITVKSFRFTGEETIATDAELQELVKEDIGRQLGINDLHAIAARVTAYLREKKGYLLPRAYLPKQDVTSGVVEIAIIAGRVDGRIKVNRKQPGRISQSILNGIADRAVPEGSAIRMEDVERATLLMGDLPGIEAKSSLEKGSAPGLARVIIDTTEGPLLNGSIGIDNQGDRYTGTWRSTGQAAANDPFGIGDQVSLSLTGAEHTVQGKMSYSLPLGTSGLAGSLSYTGLYYELGGNLANLKAHGRADTMSASLNYPFLRSRSANIWGTLGFEYQLLADEMNGITTKDCRIPVGNASVNGGFQDSFGGGGMTSLNITLYSGDIDLSAVAAAQAADDAGPKTTGTFWRSSYSLSRLQRLTQSLSLFGFARGQFTTANLDSSQKFILGGPTGVRAYPTGEGSGDEGHAFTFEARYDIPGVPSWMATQLTGFFDTGWVKLHNEPWPGSITNISGRNDYWLSGGGAGLTIGSQGTYNIRATYARTVDNNKGRSSSGKDADNRSENDRFWLNATVWF